jgi:hypothetical protein
VRRLLAPVLAPLVALSLLLVGGPAWSAPAAAAPQSAPRLARAAGQEVGDTVTLFSIDGDEEGSFTVTDLTDDFEDYDDTALELGRAERMVSLDVEIEADGGDIPVDPTRFNLVDANGALWIDIEADRTDRNESLEAAELADGDVVEGSLEIVIPTDVDISKLIYIVDNERVLTLLDFTSGVEAGDVVDIFTVQGDEAGTVVADEVFEEFEDVEPSTDLDRGFILYGIAVTIENTGDDPLPVGPESFLAVDELGTVYAATDIVERTEESLDEFPDLESGEVAPGGEVSGFVTFVVNADFPVDYVAYIPEARLYPVVDAAPSGADDDDATPAADDDDPLGPTGDDDETPTTDDETRTTDEDETPVAGDGDCAGVADWEDEAVELVQDWGAILGGVDFRAPDADAILEAAGEVEAIAEASADLDAPPVAQDLNDILTESYEASAQALTDLAEAVEADDPAGIGEAAEDIQAIGESFQTGGDVDAVLVDLRDACPDEVDDL